MFQFASFIEAEAKARSVLKERGLSDEQIERELTRIHRDHDDEDFPWSGDGCDTSHGT